MRRMTGWPARKAAVLAAPLLALAACDDARDDGVVDVAFIGEGQNVAASGLRLGPAAQHVRAATAQGLVALDAGGEIVPGLAESWIVTDGGRTYIFRLRNTQWADGTRITGSMAAQSLLRAKRDLRGTTLGQDLSGMDAAVAMAGRVVEIRLASPMPDFLQLLAQPELGIRREREGTGPMDFAAGEDGSAVLTARPPSDRGEPEREGWEDDFQPVRVVALPVEEALDGFADGRFDAVLGGTLANLPLADTGALTRGTVRLDPAVGLLGLRVLREEGPLADPAIREAVAMAIDRSDLLAPFNIAGWSPATRLAAPDQTAVQQVGLERWADLSIDQRRDVARRRVLIWRANNDARGDDPLRLPVSLPEGPGSDLLLREINADLAPANLQLERAGEGQRAQLALIDRVARFPSILWHLNQFHCDLGRAPCSPQADALVDQAIRAVDGERRAQLLSEAEAALVDANVYIPLGSPVRWAQVRGQVEGFVENGWTLHPLFALSRRPI